MKFRNEQFSLKIMINYATTREENGKRTVRTQRSTNDYEAHTQRTHILEVPDTYIGSVIKEVRDVWLFDQSKNKFVLGQTELPEGAERCFLEILSNAGDNADASRRMGVDPGSIDVSMNENWISIRNGGESIPLTPIEKSTPDNVHYITEFIFGQLLTSNNYNTNIIRMGCGRNGYGAKLTNIYSKNYIVRVGDPKTGIDGDSKSGMEWEGHWVNNMESGTFTPKPGHFWDQQNGWTLKGEPYTGPPYVEVTFEFDLKRFQMDKMTPDVFALFNRYLIDFGFTCKVPVSFNGVKYDLQNVQDYARLYWSDEIVDKAITHYEWGPGFDSKKFNSMSKKDRDYFLAHPPGPEFIPTVEILCLDTPDSGMSISYVNGLMTLLFRAILWTSLSILRKLKANPKISNRQRKRRYTS